MSRKTEPSFASGPPPMPFDEQDGEDAVAFAARFGLVLDPWQADLCRLWMRRSVADGKWCAGTWGISVPRQNGKNAALEAVQLYGTVVLGLRFLHTAHEMKTAVKHFRRMKHFFGEKRNDPNARFPQLNALVHEIRNTKTQEAIILRDPSTGADLGSIEFVARTDGSGRGFTADVLVLDEGQHLSDEHLEAARPAISAAPSGDPVAIYMGTPPKPDALSAEGKGAAFIRIRSNVIRGDAPRAAWMEYGAGLDIDLDVMHDDDIRALAADMKASKRANPAFGVRVFESTLVDEFNDLGPRSYCRERLNIWPRVREAGEGAIALADWSETTVDASVVDESWRLACIGLDMDLTGRLWAAAGVHAEEGDLHVELWPDDLLAEGVQAAVDRLYRACGRRKPLVIPGDSGATMLEGPLRAKGAKVYRLNSDEMSQASLGLVQALRDRAFSHVEDPVLTESVKESSKVPMTGGRWRLGRVGEFGGAPLLAVAGARHGAARWSRRPSTDRTTTGRSSGGRSAGGRPSGRR